MATRLLNHVMHFGKADKKKIVPLAYAVLSISNPKINTMDILFKLAYDTDSDIALRAIICLGLVGAGTNNSRLAEIFRKLASYYSKDSDTLFCVRMAQGLLYMGKGMVSLQPYYSERFLLSKVGMSGVLIFLTSLFDIKSTFLLKHHYFIYFLSLAMYPKSLFVVIIYVILVKRQVGANASQHQSRSGSRCRWPGRKAQENHRVPNTHLTSAYRKWIES
jgi:26S proteasome regulatory subunit N1